MYDGNHELVAACIQGEERAWEELWATSGPVVKAIARRLGCTHEEACDVLQMVALATVQYLHQLRDPERLGGWIGTTARRAAAQVLRWRTPTTPLTPGAALDPRNPEALAYRAERAVMLRLAMRQLDPRCRRIILRLELTEPPATYKEVAGREQLAPSSIGPVRRRCLTRLKKIIQALSHTTGNRLL